MLSVTPAQPGYFYEIPLQQETLLGIHGSLGSPAENVIRYASIFHGLHQMNVLFMIIVS